MPFQKATRRAVKSRWFFSGPTKSGKTYTALMLAQALAAHEGGRVAVIDTEEGESNVYANIYDFDVNVLRRPFTAQRYLTAIKEARTAGYPVLVVDSLSHLWSSEGGILDEVDNIAARAAQGRNRDGTPNTFSAWNQGGKLWESVLRALMEYPGHVICTARAKQKYVLVDGKEGKKVPEKRGMEPIVRDGTSYEFAFEVYFDIDHVAVLEGRDADLNGLVLKNPGPENFITPVLKWLQDGPKAAHDVPPATSDLASEELLLTLVNRVGWNVSGEDWDTRAPKAATWASGKRTKFLDELTAAELQKVLDLLVKELPEGTDLDDLPDRPALDVDGDPA